MLLSACDTYFDLDMTDIKPVAVLYCFPQAGTDTTYIQLSQSIPLPDPGWPVDGIPGADITFTVNGEPREVRWADEELPSVPEYCYYAVGPIAEGDVVSIEARLGDLPPVSSTTVVPPAFPLVNLSTEIVKSSSDLLQFRITFRDDRSTDDYYGVRVVRRSTSIPIGSSYDESSIHWSEYPITFYYDINSDPLLFNRMGLDETFETEYYRLDDIYIWEDLLISGKDYTLTLNTYYYKPSDWETEWNGTKYRNEESYRITLYRLSREFYQYLKSYNDVMNNDLGQDGLAPLGTVLTNIRGGYGIAGACTIYQSPWIPNPVLPD